MKRGHVENMRGYPISQSMMCLISFGHPENVLLQSLTFLGDTRKFSKMTKAFDALKDRLVKAGCVVTDTAPGEFKAVRYSDEELVAWVEQETNAAIFDLLLSDKPVYWGG